MAAAESSTAPLSGIISRKEQLDPQTRARCVLRRSISTLLAHDALRAPHESGAARAYCLAHDPLPRPRFDAWQQRESRAHPLYARESSTYGTVPPGEERPLTKPSHAKPPSSALGVTAVTKDTERRTTLITSLRIRTSVG